MFLNVKVEDKDFTLAREGLQLELNLDVDYDATRKYLEKEAQKLLFELINRSYGHCAHCDKVFVKYNHKQKFCPSCKKPRKQ